MADDAAILGPLAVGLVGAALFVFGCIQYALAKGRSSLWGWFGLFSIFGLIIIVLLEDRSDDLAEPEDLSD